MNWFWPREGANAHCMPYDRNAYESTHVLSVDCWCEPTTFPWVGGGLVVQHRHEAGVVLSESDAAMIAGIGAM